MKRNKLTLLLLIFGIALLGINFLLLDQFVAKAYHEGNTLVDYFYPRFHLEKQRFPLAFFIEKKNQVIFRTLILLSILILLKKLPKLNVTPIYSLTTNIKVYFLVISIFVSTWILDIPNLTSMNIIYSPVKIINLFSLPKFNTTALYILFSFTVITSFTYIIKPKKTIALASFIGFILIQAIFSSYQKIDHGFTSFIYLGFCLCLFLFRKKELQRTSTMATLIISLAYFQSGLEKILISKTALFDSGNMLIHLQNHPTLFSNWLAQYPLFTEILLLSVVLFQLSFPLILFLPRLKHLYLAGGIFFHLCTYFCLGVGWWASPWSIALLLLVDWNPLLSKLLNKKYSNTGV